MKNFIMSTALVFMAGILLSSAHVSAKTGGFAHTDLRLKAGETALELNGQITFDFSKAALEALANGLPLAVETQVSVLPASRWFWQGALSSRNYKLEIRYHALSQHYLVKSMGNSYPRAFLTQSSALAALGHVDMLPLIDLSRLDPRGGYEIRIRSSLDSNSLPVPLRPLIYLSDEWRMESDWETLPWPADD